MIAIKRVILLLSTLLVLTGCVFNEKENENIILQVASSSEPRDITLKLANYTQDYEIVEEQIVGTKKDEVIYRSASNSSGVSWLASKVSDASDAVKKVTLVHTYNQFGERISSVEVPGTEEITEATSTVYEYGKSPQVGAHWYPGRVTRYGFDCGGCTVDSQGFSGTSSGMRMSGTQVKQSDGSLSNGYTFDGLYVIATSQAIPLCTVVKVSDHPFSGGGISSGEPFYAIVGNRGVSNGNIDLFAGTESNLNVITQVGSPSRSNTKVEIVGFKTHVRNGGCR